MRGQNKREGWRSSLNLMGDQNKREGMGIFVKFDKREGQNEHGGGGISEYPLISVMNEKRSKCFILMLK